MEHEQQPDTQPGEYFVTVVDGDRYARLLGPFTDNHAGALAMVEAVREKAYELDPKSHWYSFGTCRLPSGDPAARPGALNHSFGLPATTHGDAACSQSR